MERKIVICLVALFVSCTLLGGCVEEKKDSEITTTTTLTTTLPASSTTMPTNPDAASDIVEANNRFAFDLYSQYKSDEGNVFFSPYSISSALAMTYEGAKGKTAEEIKAVFHFPESSVMRSGFAAANAEINKKDKKYELRSANALWAQKDYSFLPEYFNVVEEYYGGKVTNLDFSEKTEESRLTINKWVEEQTNNKIKDLIPQGAIDSLTRLVLTNAVYFKGTWVKQFNKSRTTEKDFRVGVGKTVRTDMMSMFDERFNYTETDTLQILELPYDGGDLSMIILLPKNDDITSLESSLTAEKLADWRNALQENKIDELYLPKFKFETKYFMADTLKEMGMSTAFSDAADFSGMTGIKDLYISEVVHQAFVEVNEEGTEAAAATAVVMKLTAMPGSQDLTIFNADHPFVFVIQQKSTGNILFIGRVSDPTAV
jgi:serpin B